MLSEQERRELREIENLTTLEDPRLARLLARGPCRRRSRVAIWLLLAFVPAAMASIVNPGLGIIVIFVLMLAVVMLTVLVS